MHVKFYLYVGVAQTQPSVTSIKIGSSSPAPIFCRFAGARRDIRYRAIKQGRTHTAIILLLCDINNSRPWSLALGSIRALRRYFS